ncbi:hypothetical protein E6O75_ATG11058 [Venturia nashicola]|uniref:Uncharacterized protein n=1 Tax=Venturia nashicola TaxID=86259 RepID=A0A4Z1PK11_9PEZI|nr:hypothetical protein E6O75_ATG11058 [Venturia nashicola]
MRREQASQGPASESGSMLEQQSPTDIQLVPVHPKSFSWGMDSHDMNPVSVAVKVMALHIVTRLVTVINRVLELMPPVSSPGRLGYKTSSDGLKVVWVISRNATRRDEAERQIDEINHGIMTTENVLALVPFLTALYFMAHPTPSETWLRLNAARYEYIYRISIVSGSTRSSSPLISSQPRGRGGKAVRYTLAHRGESDRMFLCQA